MLEHTGLSTTARVPARRGQLLQGPGRLRAAAPGRPAGGDHAGDDLSESTSARYAGERFVRVMPSTTIPTRRRAGSSTSRRATTRIAWTSSCSARRRRLLLDGAARQPRQGRQRRRRAGDERALGLPEERGSSLGLPTMLRTARPDKQQRRTFDKDDQRARRRRVWGVGLLALAVLSSSRSATGRGTATGARSRRRAELVAGWPGRSCSWPKLGDGQGRHLLDESDGSGRRQLTDSSRDGQFAPRCRPTAVGSPSRAIATATPRSTSWIATAAGTCGGLTNDPARDAAPAWSPDWDAHRLHVGSRSRAAADVYVMNADGTGLERLTSDQANWAPQFSPDGRSAGRAGEPRRLGPRPCVARESGG